MLKCHTRKSAEITVFFAVKFFDMIKLNDKFSTELKLQFYYWPNLSKLSRMNNFGVQTHQKNFTRVTLPRRWRWYFRYVLSFFVLLRFFSSTIFWKPYIFLFTDVISLTLVATPPKTFYSMPAFVGSHIGPVWYFLMKCYSNVFSITVTVASLVKVFSKHNPLFREPFWDIFGRIVR